MAILGFFRVLLVEESSIYILPLITWPKYCRFDVGRWQPLWTQDMPSLRLSQRSPILSIMLLSRSITLYQKVIAADQSHVEFKVEPSTTHLFHFHKGPSCLFYVDTNSLRYPNVHLRSYRVFFFILVNILNKNAKIQSQGVDWNVGMF